LTVKRFCEERGITQYSFYAWRKRLREQGLDVDAPLADTYTREQWRSFIFITAEELFEGTRDERLARFGAAFID
jgi:uncharacterized protein (TIGR02265 family)